MVIPARGISAAALAAALLAAAGCHGDQGTGAVDAGHVPDFSACDKTDAGPYTAGIVETSSTGLFTTTLVSVRTKPMITAPAVPFPTVGDSTFEVTFLQGGGPTPAGLTVTAEKPYMPIHGHGSDVYPIVADDGGGAVLDWTPNDPMLQQVTDPVTSVTRLCILTVAKFPSQTTNATTHTHCAP